MQKSLALFVICLTLLISTVNANDRDEKPILYLYVDEMPTFNYNNESLLTYLVKNTKWPDRFDGAAQVLLSFVISRNGTIKDINTIKATSKICEEEAHRVVSNMPSWKPGLLDGKPVDVILYLPFTWVLK